MSDPAASSSPAPQSVQPSTAEGFYNQGTALLESGNPAEARAFLEKAHRLRPDVADIQANLEVARQQLGQKIGITQLDPVTPDWAAWVRPAGVPVAGPLISLGLLLGILSVWRHLRKDEFRQLGPWLRSPLPWSAAFIGLIGLLAAAGDAWIGSHPFAVALTLLEVKSGPGPEFVDLARIPPGAGFRLTGESRKSGDATEWIQILHHAQERGWIREAEGSHLVIDPAHRSGTASGGAHPHKEVAQSGS